jgi:excisionase family DNA binding protein
MVEDRHGKCGKLSHLYRDHPAARITTAMISACLPSLPKSCSQSGRKSVGLLYRYFDTTRTASRTFPAIRFWTMATRPRLRSLTIRTYITSLRERSLPMTVQKAQPSAVLTFPNPSAPATAIMPNDPNSDIMTLPEAAAFLRVCEKTVLKYAKTGRIPSKRLGTCWRFSRSKLAEWMQLEDAA